MFVLLLLLLQVSCDWVEISQNHYKTKPIHKVPVHFEHSTAPSRVYRNHSTAHKHWNRGAVDKVSNVGNVRRVQFPRVKTSSLKTRYEEHQFINNFDDHTDIPKAEYDIVPVKPNILMFNAHDELSEKQNKVSGHVLRATDIGHLKTVNIDSKHMQSSVQTAVANNYNRRKPFDYEKQILGVTDIRDINRAQRVNKSSLGEVNNKDFDSFEGNDELYSIKKLNIRKVSHGDGIKILQENLSTTNKSNTPNIKLIHRENDSENIIRNIKENYDKNNGAISSNADDSGTIHKSHDSTTRPDEYYFVTANAKKSNRIKLPNTNELVQSNRVEVTQWMDDNEVTSSEPEDISGETKGKPVNEMWKLMRVVTDSIYKNTHRSFKSKVKYLEGLKSMILTSIEDQIDRAWPDDDGSSRHARSAQARGHVEFPSSEGTLMTISFLTFAVFLIKLVLQVIHTYKNKTMMVTPAIVAAVGRAAAALKSLK